MADRLDLPLITPDDLESGGGRLLIRSQRGREEIRVIYNRTSHESLRKEDGQLTPLGELLAGPLDAGNLGCVNQFGAGIADDKAVHCYVDRMIPFYLDEKPILRSVPGFDLGEPDQLAEVIDRLDELVIKPRWSYGGKGLVFGPRASASELEEATSRVEADPAASDRRAISGHSMGGHGALVCALRNPGIDEQSLLALLNRLDAAAFAPRRLDEAELVQLGRDASRMEKELLRSAGGSATHT